MTKKVPRRPLKAVDQRPRQERSDSEAMSKLSVLIPESVHQQIKVFCAAQSINIKDWVREVLSTAAAGARR